MSVHCCATLGQRREEHVKQEKYIGWCEKYLFCEQLIQEAEVEYLSWMLTMLGLDERIGKE